MCINKGQCTILYTLASTLGTLDSLIFFYKVSRAPAGSVYKMLHCFFVICIPSVQLQVRRSKGQSSHGVVFHVHTLGVQIANQEFIGR